MTRVTLLSKLREQLQEMKRLLKPLLACQKHVCVTSDAWSTTGQGYLGATAHWINSESLSRESAALACSRLRGSHTYDVIAKALCTVFSEYDLSSSNGKLVCCITDNGANFLKAFRELGLKYGNIASSPNVANDRPMARDMLTVTENNDNDNSDDEEIVLQDEDDYDEFSSIQQITESLSNETDREFELPPHHPCSSHTLSLVAVSDSQKALKDNATFKKLHNAAMGKCSALWNSSSRSIKNCEAIEKIVHRRLVKPCPTRWNSLYDSMVVLNEIRSSLKAVCQAVGVAVFKDAELEFIAEYVTALKPIAVALDRLQGNKAESNAFMGFLLPTLLTVRQKLAVIIQSASLKHCCPLAEALLHGLEKRFRELFDFKPASNSYIVAAVSHPFFKLRWIPQQHVEKCRLLFTNTCTQVESDMTSVDVNGGSTTTNATSSSDLSSSATVEDEFFIFDSVNAQRRQIHSQVQIQCALYLEDTATATNMLHKYPLVKEVFCKYNTAIPSSAPVERLFSFGGLIHTKKETDFQINHLRHCCF